MLLFDTSFTGSLVQFQESATPVILMQALRRTLCQQEPAQKLLTQTGHCSTAVAEQLAFLACQSNGLVHLFEETACSHLLELQQGAYLISVTGIGSLLTSTSSSTDC